MIKKILVTSDLSDESRGAFPMACAMADTFSAEIELLAVVEDPAQAALMYALDYPVVPGSEVLEQLMNQVTKDLGDLAKSDFSSQKVTTTVIDATGPVHSAIIEQAKKSGVDLVIMATHGRTGISRLLIGSVVERVVRECPIPVLTVPSSAARAE